MQLRVKIINETPVEWINAVMADFPSFLQDHANCERKVSAMAMSFVAKYPDRVEIIEDLIDTSIEEMEHFRDVYKVMAAQGIQLTHEISEDLYVKQLLALCRTGRDERFLDRLIIASIIECRAAERFKMVYKHVEDKALKELYHRLWASEAKHGDIFVKLALHYFDEATIYSRLNELNEAEGTIMLGLPFKAALH